MQSTDTRYRDAAIHFLISLPKPILRHIQSYASQLITLIMKKSILTNCSKRKELLDFVSDLLVLFRDDITVMEAFSSSLSSADSLLSDDELYTLFHILLYWSNSVLENYLPAFKSVISKTFPTSRPNRWWDLVNMMYYKVLSSHRQPSGPDDYGEVRSRLTGTAERSTLLLPSPNGKQPPAAPAKKSSFLPLFFLCLFLLFSLFLVIFISLRKEEPPSYLDGEDVLLSPNNDAWQPTKHDIVISQENEYSERNKQSNRNEYSKREDQSAKHENDLPSKPHEDTLFQPPGIIREEDNIFIIEDNEEISEPETLPSKEEYVDVSFASEGPSLSVILLVILAVFCCGSCSKLFIVVFALWWRFQAPSEPSSLYTTPVKQRFNLGAPIPQCPDSIDSGQSRGYYPPFSSIKKGEERVL